LATGVKEYSTKTISRESIAVVSKPSTKLASAPVVSGSVGKIVAPSVKDLPKSTSVSATIVVNGKTLSLGSFKTSTSGALQLPGFNAKAGTYTIGLKAPNGKTYFVKLVIKAKK
jgi:hypothetical protein